jgi:hypothetical protein
MLSKSVVFLLAVTLFSITVSFAEEQIFSVVLIQAQPEDRAVLRSLMAEIDSVRPDGRVVAYIPQENLHLLTSAGFIYEVLYADSRDICKGITSSGDMETKDPLTLDFSQYHDPTALNQALQELHTNYPAVTELYTVGYSVEGEEINALLITDNAGTEEAEPEIRLVGLHHGNEMIGVEVPLYFANYLLTHQPDRRVQNIINNTEVWVCPMINPDGWWAGTRHNHNGVDLNRNYSYMWDPYEEPYAGDYPFSEPETQAVRNFSTTDSELSNYPNNFVISHTYHSGAECVNYVWNYADADHHDGTDHPTPDDDVIEDIAHGYADVCNPPMTWVTNGCEWYATWGDLNDWSYGERSDNDYTIELYNGWNPPDEQIITYCNKHIPALLYTCEAALTIGIKGIVQDGASHEPLKANIDVDDRQWPWFTDPAMGDFYRLLLPGTYDVTISASGYSPVTMNEVQVIEGTMTDLGIIYLEQNNDVQLLSFDAQPLPDGIQLNWKVSDDQGELTGFNLYRQPLVSDSTSQKFPLKSDNNLNADLNSSWTKSSWVKLNPSPISGDNPYSYVDSNLPQGQGYSYKLEAIYQQERLATLGITTGLPGERNSFSLAQNYPNPASSSTTISFSLNADSPTPTRLSIYDLSGRLVTTLLDSLLSSGEYQATWDLQSNDGSSVASGIYIYQLNCGTRSQTCRMVVVR